MSKKNYFCKDCGHNNNGWCPIKKRNGLKDITECDSKTTNDKSCPIEIDVEKNRYEYEAIGKRLMYWSIQRQIIALDEEPISNEEKYIELIQVLNNLGDMLESTERIGNTLSIIELSEVESDMRKDSIHIKEMLKSKYGSYKNSWR